jgi:PAS domain S-box-containing protein
LNSKDSKQGLKLTSKPEQKFSLTLGQKGFILVALPLLFELIFVAAIAFFFNEQNTANLQQAQDARNLLKLLLLLGVVLNILLAVGLAAFFNRGTRQRLNIVIQNAARLTKKQPLLPAMTERDEIAHLDQVFHDMADALEAAARKERAIVEHLPVGVVDLTPDGVIEGINPSVPKLFGVEAQSLLGRRFEEFLLSLDSGEKLVFTDVIAQTLQSKHDYKAVRASGDELIVAVRLTEYEVASGKRLLANIVDITEEHRIEQLRKEVVAMVSHDLRAPLTSVKTFIQLLGMGSFGKLSQQAEARVPMAERNLTRLIGLINDLLDIEKLESGSMPLNITPVPIKQLMEDAADSLRDLASKKALEFKIEAGDEVASADRDRILQVLINLLSNAVKFSPERETVIMRARAEGQQLRISVIDKGPGIAESEKNLVFDKFKQLEGSKEAKGGSGLGLAIAKAIVVQHKGTIGVDSALGQGTTFWFTVAAESTAYGDQASKSANSTHQI